MEKLPKPLRVEICKEDAEVIRKRAAEAQMSLVTYVHKIVRLGLKAEEEERPLMSQIEQRAVIMGWLEKNRLDLVNETIEQWRASDGRDREDGEDSSR
jgi:hypothetical protein